MLGWSFSKLHVPNENELKNLQQLSYLFGQIFQVADDFEDIKKDMKSGAKFNHVLINGKTNSFNYISECIDKFNIISENMNLYTKEIKEAVAYLYKKVESNM